MIIIILPILKLIGQILGYNQSLNCSESCQQAETNNKTNIINCNIDKLNEINLSCQNFQTTEIHIIPKNKKIVLDKKLDIDYEIVNANLVIVYRRLVGISLSSNAFDFKTEIDVVVYNSKFVFYSMHGPFTDLQCNETYLTQRKYPRLFRIISHLKLSRMNYLQQKTCPLLFKNSSIRHLSVNYLCDSFIEKNFIQFVKMPDFNQNFKIFTLSFEYFYRLFNYF